jgi:hypothetical protein
MGVMIYDVNNEDTPYSYFPMGDNGYTYTVSDYEDYLYRRVTYSDNSVAYFFDGAETDNPNNLSYGTYWNTNHTVDISGKYTDSGVSLTRLIIYFYDLIKMEKNNVETASLQ